MDPSIRAMRSDLVIAINPTMSWLFSIGIELPPVSLRVHSQCYGAFQYGDECPLLPLRPTRFEPLNPLRAMKTLKPFQRNQQPQWFSDSATLPILAKTDHVH